MKKRKRKFIERRWVISALSWLIVQFIRLSMSTSRLSSQVPEASLPYVDGRKNAVFAFWHGRMMIMPAMSPDARPMHVMISHHGDGELIARAMKRYGFGTVRGSRSRGGSRAAAGAVGKLTLGHNVCMTPDGPRGPHQVAASGVVGIARIAGVPVIPVSFGARRHLRLRSWDRFMLALPFGEIFFIAGEPIAAPAESAETDEAIRQRIEAALNAITLTADDHWNAAPSL